jgi:hypothetical protein
MIMSVELLFITNSAVNMHNLNYITRCAKETPGTFRCDILTGTINDKQRKVVTRPFEVVFDGRECLFDGI